MDYNIVRNQDEIANGHRPLRVSFRAKLDRLGSIQWPCNDAANPKVRRPCMFTVRTRQGQFLVTEYVPTTERSTSRFR